MDVFDIIGPIMIGPSSSHTAGAARIGKYALNILGAKPVKADIYFSGSFAKTYKGHGTDKAIVAGILGMDFAKKSMFGKNMENTSITELDYDTDSEMFTLERFNDYTHLEGKPELLRSSWK